MDKTTRSVATLLAETANVIDPQGESDDVSLLCGMAAWALDQGDAFTGWDRESVQAAIRWNWRHSTEYAEEQIERFESCFEYPARDFPD